jgi:hypothetical protein
MKNNPLKGKHLLITLLLLIFYHPGNICCAQRSLFVVDSLTLTLDGHTTPFNQVVAGDTILLLGGNRKFLAIRNFTGTTENPIVFINGNGIVTIETDHYYGILVENCRYIHITGTGVENEFYGIRIDKVLNGAGVSMAKLTSDVELDHVSVRNTLMGAIYSKTDPDCLFNSTREKFIQYNTVIHDNYIENAVNEGMYIGSTKYFGQHLICGGVDTLLLPHLLDGVNIYNNIIKYVGGDGIQVSSASSNCRIYDNVILFDSQDEVYGQMAGILIGGGSKCDCYNNYIANGKGNGIESHGLGGYRIFNNIIENAGLGYLPSDLTQMKYGILVTDVTAQQDSSFNIFHNNILHPKSDGIRFMSVHSRHNIIASNMIIDPGNFDFYENGHYNVKGKDAYVMEPDTSADISLLDNFFSRSVDSAGFVPFSFSLSAGSKLIDAGYTGNTGIQSDFYHHPRQYGSKPDIGAIEFDPAYLGIPVHQKPDKRKVKVFPEPVRESMTLQFQLPEESKVVLDIYHLNGKQAGQTFPGILKAGLQSICINVADFPPGLYLYTLRTGNQYFSGKFIKAGN